MKIAVVSPYSLERPGGVQAQAEGLAGWLRSRGHEAWLVGPGNPAATRYRFAGRVTTVPANGSAAPISLDPRAPAATRRAVRGADVVHVHEPLAPLIGPASFLGAGPPAVGTFHSDPSPLLRSIYRLGAPAWTGVTAHLASLTAVSDVAFGAVRPFVPGVAIIPNGIDVASYAVDVPRRAGRVAFVGRDEPRKGLDILLAAWPLVLSRVPAAELVVIGAHRRRAGPGVRFLGPATGEEVRQELAAATVLCAPNLGGESFGLVIVEGMAAGCTVVLSDLTAFRAVAGVVGRYVRPGDPAALSTTLVGALANPCDPEAMRDAALPFDWSRVGPQYLDQYRRVAV